MRVYKAIFIAVLATLLVFGGSAFQAIAENLVPNPSFEEGNGTPAQWRLSGGKGEWETPGRTGRRCISVTGDGQTSNYWATPCPKLEVLAPYRFSFWARQRPGTSGGCFVSGPSFCNRDFHFSEQWQRYSFVFCAPSQEDEAVLRLGQWMVNGSGQFDDVALEPVLAVHTDTGDGIALGEGEELTGQTYSFRSDLGGPGSNYSRCLYSANAYFNSNRWCFGPGQEVVYKFQVGDIPQNSGRLTVNIGWYAAGTCLIEAARQPGQWQAIGQMAGLGSKTFELPATLFPTPAIYIRLRSPGAQEKSADFAPGSFQVYGLDYVATLARELGQHSGHTAFFDLLRSDERLAVKLRSVGSLLPGEEQIELVITPRVAGRLRASVALVPGKTTSRETMATAGRPVTMTIPYTVSGAGDCRLTITVALDGRPAWAAETEFYVPTLYAADYGYAIASRPNLDVWWCESTYKIAQTRPAPTKVAPVRLAAARNEYEPVQIVLRPKAALRGLKATISDFSGPSGAKIPATAWTIRYVYYLYVTIPTDESSCRGYWPDPLPPLREGEDLSLPPGKNFPLWLTVKVPADARPGLYRGTLTIQAGQELLRVPLTLQVYDFTLPARSHLATAWGWSLGNVIRYHNLKDPEDIAKVRDLYLQDFREHRISPYSFGGQINVRVEGIEWKRGKVVGDQAAAGRRSLLVIDDNPQANVSATTARLIPIEKGVSYRLAWAVKTAQPGQLYHLTVGCHDAQGEWIPNHNIDLVFEGTGEWQRQEITLPPERFPENCTQVGLTLWGARWSEKGENVAATWWDDLYFGRADGGPNLLPDPSFEAGLDKASIVVDWSEFDPLAKRYLDEFGFNGFVLPIQFLGWGRAPHFNRGQIGPFEEGTPEYERLFAQYVQELQNHLEQNGWLEKAYLYWFDEPEEGDYEFVRQTNERIHKYAPKLRRMLTEQPEPPLYGAVDIWCPVTPNYNPQRCRERQQLGETIWWYICCGPRAPWVGLFIDHGATELRVWLWQTWQNNVQGCLIWESTWWDSPGAPKRPQNPWEDPMGWTPEGGTWGNGDGRFLYPANRNYPNDPRPYVEGPVDSFRWEMLREGLEDWEYLYLLRQAIEKKLPSAEKYARLLVVPPSISQDMTHFAREPQPIFAQRAKIAAALERLHVDRLGIK